MKQDKVEYHDWQEKEITKEKVKNRIGAIAVATVIAVTGIGLMVADRITHHPYDPSADKKQVTIESGDNIEKIVNDHVDGFDENEIPSKMEIIKQEIKSDPANAETLAGPFLKPGDDLTVPENYGPTDNPG
jgi:cell division protein YceG involved in septum cleavage